jgi:hypothetical protein
MWRAKGIGRARKLVKIMARDVAKAPLPGLGFDIRICLSLEGGDDRPDHRAQVTLLRTGLTVCFPHSQTSRDGCRDIVSGT